MEADEDQSIGSTGECHLVPITQEKLGRRILVVFHLSLSHSSVFVELTHTCRHTDPSNCQESRMLPLSLDLGH